MHRVPDLLVLFETRKHLLYFLPELDEYQIHVASRLAGAYLDDNWNLLILQLLGAISGADCGGLSWPFNPGFDQNFRITAMMDKLLQTSFSETVLHDQDALSVLLD